MKKLIFLLIFTLFILSWIGCESQNPICGDTFCVDGSVFFKSELADDTEYDSVSVDETGLLALIGDATPVGTMPVEPITLPPGVNSVELTTIVEDVAAGNTTFLHDWVYLEALVTSDLTDGGRSLSLETDNDNVNFRVSSFVKKSQLARWTKGNQYRFILFISDIDTNANTGITTISSRVDDPDNIANGRSVLTPGRSKVEVASINVMLESFRQGESYYIGKRVTFLDTVKIRQDNQTAEHLGTTYDRLVVYSENVGLFATSRDSFSIYPTIQLFDGEIDAKYSKGSLHNFEVTIHYLSGEDFFNPNKVNIVGYFEDKTFLPSP